MQEGMLYHSLSNPKTDPYFVQLNIKLMGRISVKQLENTINQLIGKYEILRSNFLYEKLDSPKQVIFKKKQISISTMDLRKVDSTAQTIEIQRYMSIDRENKFDLAKDKLMRFHLFYTEENESILLWSLHHILLDGWSISILLSEIQNIYNNEKVMDLATVKYSDYIDWTNQINKDNAKEYWRKYLKSYDTKAFFPRTEIRKSETTGKNESLNFYISADRSKKLTELSRKLEVSQYCVLQALWGAILTKYCGQKDIVTGMVHSGREVPIDNIDKIVGNLINTIPLRMDFNNTIADVINKVQRDMFIPEEFKAISLADIQEVSQQKMNLFDSVIVFENYPLEKIVNGDKLIISNIESTEQTNYPLSVAFFPGKEIRINLSFEPEMISKKLVSRIERHFMTLIDFILEDPNRSINQLCILEDDEINEVLNLSGYENRSDIISQSIVEKFSSICTSNPNDLAIIDGQDSITYGELGKAVNIMAENFLLDLGTNGTDVIAIIGKRSINLIVTMLACFKANKIYLPIDDSFPIDRINFMLKDSKSRIVLKNSEFTSKIEHNEILIVDEYKVKRNKDLNKNKKNSENNHDNGAYIIYTSGTTGKPKAVLNQHFGLSNFIESISNDIYKIQSDDRVAQFASISFDASIQEILLALTNGIRLYLVPEKDKYNFEEFKRFFFEEKITLVTLPPSYLRELKCLDFPYLRYVTTVGSASSKILVNEWKDKYINGYGPSECTIGLTHWFAAERNDYNIIPVGKPIKNTYILILDEYNNLLPIGVYGEICIGGVGVGLGYLNSQDLTKQKFIKSPFDNDQVLYKTGDLGRLLFDGNIEFLSRKDKQVKIRGQRVELGEIESELLQHNKITNVAVLNCDSPNGESMLVAFFTSNEILDGNIIKQHLRETLVEYMVPNRIIQIDQIPINTSGKTDEKKLKKLINEKENRNEVLPTTEMQKSVHKIWSGVLNSNIPSIDDNFFDIGGHSLKAIQLVSSIQKNIGLTIDIHEIFENPTIRELSNMLQFKKEKVTEEQVEKIRKISKEERQHLYHLTSAQQRMYTLQVLDPEKTHYNVPYIFDIQGNLNSKKLEMSINCVINNHDMFKTNYIIQDGSVLQRESSIERKLVLKTYRVMDDEKKIDEKIQSLIYPFNLEKDLLLRASLLKISDFHHLLFIDIHHIACDGLSIELLNEEMWNRYNGESKKEEKVDFFDYVVWKSEVEKNSQKELDQKEYWGKKLSGELPILELPTDFPRPQNKTFEGSIYQFALSEKANKIAKKYLYQEKVTPNILFLALYYILISKYSQQKDIIVGSPISGRKHEATQKIIGLFVNTIVTRVKIDNNMSFKEVLEIVKSEVFDGIKFGDYAFELLLDDLKISRSMDYSPIFQTMFTYQVNENEMPLVNGLTVKPYNYDYKHSKFDLTVSVAESDEGFVCGFEYSTELFKPETIQRFSKSFEYLVSQLPSILTKTIGEIEVLSTTDKEEQFKEINTDFHDQELKRAVPQIFLDRVSENPDSIAIETCNEKISYKELEMKSNTILQMLLRNGVSRGSKVGICMKKNPMVIATMLAILKAGAAYVPINSSYPIKRIKFIIEDSNVQVICVDNKSESVFSSFTEKESSSFDFIRIISESINFLGTIEENTFRKDEVYPQDIAYIMYTSGTTGNPKGVQITQKNIINLVNDANYLDFNKSKVFLQLSPLEFDASTFEIWGSLLNGAKLVFSNVEKPSILELNELIISKKVTSIFLTTAYFNTIVETDSRMFSYLDQALIGGEKISVKHVKQIIGKHDCELLNVYGPTENTTFSTFYRIPKKIIHSDIPIGKSITNSEAYILDENLNVVPKGCVGELCLSGEGLSIGYLNNEQKNKESFVKAKLIDREETIYRTGDYVKLDEYWNLCFIGRIDNQIKRRGHRIELEEIENCLNSSSDVTRCAVKYWDMPESKYIVAYIMGNDRSLKSKIEQYLRKALPEFMLPDFIEIVPELKLNENGKVDRTTLKKLKNVNDNQDKGLPKNKIQRKLLKIWRRVLNTDLSSIKSDFFRIGGNSLLAIKLISEIEKEFTVVISVKQAFENCTVESQSNLIIRERENNSTLEYNLNTISASKEKLECSASQKRLFVLQEMDPELTHYNMPMIVSTKGEIDLVRLEQAFQRLLLRHSVLRSTFSYERDTLYQKIRSVEGPILKIEKANSRNEALDKANAEIKPFNLEEDIPFRTSIFTYSNEESILLIDMHHISSDGGSIELMMKELSEYYSEEYPLNRDEKNYAAYAKWEINNIGTKKFNECEQYWLQELNHPLPVLNLETDYIRPKEPVFDGAHVNLDLSDKLTKSLKTLSEETNTTLFMLFLSAYSILLKKHTGQSDILIGSPVTLRQNQDTMDMIGMFANTIVTRSYPMGQKSIRDLLSEVKSTTLNNFDNSYYPFDQLVSKVDKYRDSSRNPVFQTMFTVNQQMPSSFNIFGYESKLISPQKEFSKFDLTLGVNDIDNKLSIEFQYSTSLYKHSRIKRMSKNYLSILQSMVENIDQKIDSLDILDDYDKQEITEQFNDTYAERDHNAIHIAFNKIARKYPTIPALRFNGRVMSYKDLDLQSDNLAKKLIELGVKLEDRVAIFMDRSMEMIIAMLGILKAGGAYVPLSTEFPEERISFILEDSSAKLCIINGEEQPSELLLSNKTKLVDLQLLRFVESTQKLPEVKENNLAYIIYTSGTTGKPKGVMLEHKGVPNVVSSFNRIFSLKPGENFLLFANTVFDTSVGEIWTALLTGSTLNIPNPDVIYNYSKFENFVHDLNIVGMILPPTYLNYLDRDKFYKVRKIIVGGSLSTPQLAQKWKGLFVNAYGPTEATVTATLYTDSQNLSNMVSVPIGRPLNNIKVFILDENLKLVPIGVKGKIYIGGVPIARGYINNERLTKECFIENPFSKGEKLYNSGDLGLWLENGNIQFLGREDKQIKIRGFRIELGEIETIILEDENVSNTVVVCHEVENKKIICAYIVPSKNDENLEHRILEKANKKLPDYMIPQKIYIIDRLPLNTSDKVDIEKLPKPTFEESNSTIVEFPRTELENRILAIWNDVLGSTSESVTDNFFYLGGDSLLGIKLISDINHILGFKITIRDLFENPTVRDICKILNRETIVTKKITPLHGRPFYQTSRAQKRMYVLQQINTNSTSYNMPFAIELSGKIDVEKLDDSIRRVINRHDIFRTTFHVIDDELKQIVRNSIPLSIERQKIADHDYSFIKNEVKPFDLSKDQLIRVKIFELFDNRLVLFIDIHHIISDGISTEILLSEISSVYGDKPLKTQFIQYKDYAEWENEQLSSGEYSDDEKYWLDTLGTDLPILDLPTDYLRKNEVRVQGGNASLRISKKTSEEIVEFCRKKGMTLNMVLLTAYVVLLHKHSLQDRILIGTPSSGRNHQDIKEILGMFVNSIVMDIRIDSNQTLDELMEKVKETALSAYEHADYPFDMLVEKIGANRIIGRNPVFQTMFIVQENQADKLSIEDAKTKLISVDNNMLKLDLSFVITKDDNGLICNFTYSKELYKESTINRLLQHYINIINKFLLSVETKINDLKIISHDEFFEVTSAFNKTDYPLPRVNNIDEFFLNISEINPYKNILAEYQRELCYESLNRKINTLGKSLLEKGVKKGDVVGIFTKRSIETVISIFAIWRIGAVSLPINIELPSERINFMMKDSCTKCVVFNTEHSKDLFKEIGIKIDINQIDETKVNEIFCPATLKSNAHIVYTSGTTGNPKGVIFTHEGIINLTAQFGDDLKKNNHIVGQFSNLAFDGIVSEIANSILIGNPLIIIPDNILFNFDEFVKYMNYKKITMITLPPSYMRSIKRSDLKFLKIALAVGAETPKDLYEEWKDIYMNGYGPSEATVATSMYKPVLDRKMEVIPIGKPVPNKKVYILDDNLNPQPIGVPGEIYIGGIGISKGYLNRKELTEEKFIVNPFEKNGFMYKTGDIGRYLETGNLEFLGRKDFQVKIRGQRLETLEVENVMLSNPNITDTSVIGQKQRNGEVVLIGFYVSNNSIADAELKNYLREKLPEYMIPTTLYRVKEIPHTTNQKVDREKLLELPIINSIQTINQQLSTTEKKVENLWRDVLECSNEIDISSNFFDVGGDSLKMIKITSSISKLFKVDFSASDFLKTQSIEKIATLLDNGESNEYNGSKKYLQELCFDDLNEKNVFCFPPVTGFGSIFRQLSQEISDSKHNIYSFDFLEDPSREQIYYLDIVNLSRNKSITIIGYSAGCALAFEIVKLLEKRGYKVENLICIDGKPQDLTDRLSENEMLEAIEETVRELFDSKNDYDVNRSIFFSKVSSTYHYLNILQTKGSIKSDLHLIISEENESYKNAWNDFTLGSSQTHFVGGKHLEMLYHPNVTSLKGIIRSIMNY